MRGSQGLIVALLFCACGCGPAESVIPTNSLTDEQNAAVKAEDEAIAEEESGGNYSKTNKKSLNR